ncbi:ROK family protein [Burkholderiaceae bacterium FT117]|uniref:ROK family protein n=1 Tax=Zeimonas sediminis TaxID=2944268 RepID=UPI00234309B0|nr:ROK family protein [Zeimonas sediminis]MCM5570516.1 ROK family protein [Zeimonas sediminis]
MRIGIDLGGTKIEVAVLDGAGGETFRHRIPSPRGDYEATLAAIASLVALAEARCGAASSIGLGIPGSLSPHTGLVRNANSTWLNGRPLGADLERALGRRVAVANDANCFALSEATDGAAAGLSVVFGVILGTGVGGGIVVNGRVLNGANGIAGEWGHNPLPGPFAAGELPGPACWCGRRGCVEAWLSGPALAADHARSAGKPGSQAAVSPTDAAGNVLQAGDASAVVAAMRAGDPKAVASFDRYCGRLARALAGVINLLDPDAIVLGGGLSKVDELYDELPRRWAPLLFADRARTPLLRNRHGDSSGVRGAARLVVEG